MPFTATWMDLEIIILSEVSQTEKDKYHMISVKMFTLCPFTEQFANVWYILNRSARVVLLKFKLDPVIPLHKVSPVLWEQRCYSSQQGPWLPHCFHFLQLSSSLTVFQLLCLPAIPWSHQQLLNQALGIDSSLSGMLSPRQAMDKTLTFIQPLPKWHLFSKSCPDHPTSNCNLFHAAIVVSLILLYFFFFLLCLSSPNKLYNLFIML